MCAISADGTIRINNSIVLLNNTSYIGAIEPGSSMPTGDYEGYDICLYTGNGDILFGNNNITTYDNWSESCTGNIPVFYAYETETEEAMITVSYDGDEAIFTGEDAFQTFLDAFFANVYDSTASPESLDTEDYRLVGTAYWALDMGDVSLAVEADGTQIAYDLDGTDRVLGDSVDIGAYEHGSGQHHDKLTVTTTDDVIDPEDNKISLREALAYAEQLGGATVKFLSDLAGGQIILDASLGGLTVSSDITIDATNLLNDDGEPSLVVNGANLGHRIFTVESSATEVAVTGLILAYGSSDDSAGAIYSEAGALVLNAVRFMYNTSIGSGGALYALGGVSLSDCTFENNASDADGGALYAASRLTMTTTTFRANSAGSAGGALYVSDVAAIEDSVFNSNMATGTGGALYGTGTVTITDTAFTKNSATDGGAIGSSGSLSVYTSELRGNTAENNGGAFHLAGTTMLSYTIVSENRATVDGGGFYQDGASLTLINSQTDRNIAARGGGFFLAEGSLSTLRNVTLTANTADSADGLYIESDATANLYNTIAAINGNGEDAVAESGAELNAYAVLSGYTDWTNKSEGHWNEYDAHYQLFSNKLTDGVYTLSLTASQAIDQGVNAHAVDENGNELTEDVLGNTRIVRTKSSSPEAIVDLGVYECQSTDGRNIQQVYGKEDSITVLAGEEIAPAIEHQVIKLFNDSDATTLSLRIHFDSLYLLFDPSDPGLYLHTDMMGQGNFTVYSDTEDYDSDPTTDSYLLITWNNQNKLWGGAEITEIFSELRFKVSSALDTTQDSSTYIRFTAANITANFQFISAPIEICVDRVTFDVDGDGVVNTSTDVNLLLRYMAGKRGNNLTDNLIYDSSTRDAVAIESYLDAYGSIFDIDGDGHFNVTIDGELLSRYLAGFTADELLYGISFTSAAVRTSSFEIETYIKSYLTGVAEAEPTTENAHTITVAGDGEAVAGEMIALNLTHAITPTDNPLTATTLSLRLYYDSDYFTLDTSLLSYYTTGLVGPAVNPYVIGVDSSNEDGDLATDSWIQISWNRESGWAWNSAQIHSLLKAVFKVNDVAADSDSEPIVSTLHITSHDRTAGFKMDDVDIPLMVIPTHFSETDALWLFDIDGSGSVDIATDGNLLMRYLIFGNVMSADGLLVNGVSTRTEEEILEYLNMYRKAFDIDGDGIVKLDTDVTYFMKFFAGYRGDGLQIANPSKKAIRTTGDELGSYIKRFIPSDQRDDPPTAAALPTALGAGAPLLMAALLPDVGVSAAELPPEKFSVNISSSMTAKAVAPQQVAVTSTSVISVVLPKSEKDGPAPEAAARLWEKPLEDDWLLPELSMLDKSVEFFRPADEITSFDFDTNWFAHF